jgi:uncharacterized protein (UPF0332 family)
VSLAADLLDQAEHLATRERSRPKQASLRRSISTAYYSLFHLLIEDASRSLVGGSRLAVAVARSFEHQAIKTAATAMGDLSRKPTVPHWLRAHVDAPISPELVVICDAFVNLQDQRHRADYDTSASFTRLEANGFVNLARMAHALWGAHRTTHNGHVLMLASAKLLRAR